MNAKILLIAFSAAAFTSCSTAYKSGQTPDDVYYSPVRMVDEKKDNDTRREETRPAENTADNNRIRMAIRDRRWRDLNYDYDYDYSYNYSPYHYCTCNCNNYGYYYNPYYFSRPLYYPSVVRTVPVNSTPRMVNLNSYKNYAAAVNTNPKLGYTTTQNSSGRYNNSNNSGSKFGNILRQVLTPGSNSNTPNNNNSTNNNSRSYSPSTNSSSGSSGGSSSGGSSGGSVSRPGRG